MVWEYNLKVVLAGCAVVRSGVVERDMSWGTLMFAIIIVLLISKC